LEAVKKFYVLTVKGYEKDKLAAVTLLFEGNKEEQEEVHRRTLATAKKFHGMAAGADNGMRGYLLTFLIAYLRDFACNHKISAESFETSVPWSNVSTLVKRVNNRIYEESAKHGFSRDKVWVSFRVTQLYETGAAIYVYLSLVTSDHPEGTIVETYEAIEDAARDETMAAGGCISHHHGVGKLRKGFSERTQPKMAIKM
jgi:alkyldihydroxyacetonephosphate synthase